MLSQTQVFDIIYRLTEGPQVLKGWQQNRTAIYLDVSKPITTQ